MRAAVLDKALGNSPPKVALQKRHLAEQRLCVKSVNNVQYNGRGVIAIAIAIAIANIANVAVRATSRTPASSILGLSRRVGCSCKKCTMRERRSRPIHIICITEGAKQKERVGAYARG